ncbi:MAG: hypothetical protein AAGF45_09390 [Pseudomonadota bacterium]
MLKTLKKHRRRDTPDPRHPSLALFDADFYRSRYPDVGRTKVDPLKHYLVHGAPEGRQPHALFDPHYYLATNDDVRAAGADPLVHYLTNGWKEDRRPHVLFDSRRYALRYGVGPGQAQETSPLLHYLWDGWRCGNQPHRLFDPAYYLCANPEVAQSGVEPLSHYLLTGWREGKRPNPVFDPAWYLNQYDDVRGTGAEPLTHYLAQGWREKRLPTAEFEAFMELKAAQSNDRSPFEAMMDDAAFRARFPNLFDPQYFRSLNPDLDHIPDAQLFAAFALKGAGEGRIAHPVEHRAVALSHTAPEGTPRPRRRLSQVGRPQYSAPLVIAGFHRSGTSMTANMLADAGLHVGDVLLGARTSNPYGHFEDMEILRFHDRLLRQAGQSWYAASEFPAVMTTPDWRAMAAYGFKKANHAAWGFRDPRVCLFLNEWASVFPDMSVLYVYRPCIECVHSLKKRAAANYANSRAVPLNLSFFTRDDVAVRMYLSYARKALRFLDGFGGRAKVVALSDLLSNRDIVGEIRSEWDYQLADVLPFDVYDGKSLTQGGPNELISSPELIHEIEQVERAFEARLN